MNAYRELIRKKLLEEVYDGLSPEDKRTFVQLTLQDKGWNDVLQSLDRQEHQIGDIHKKVAKQTWLSDFSSNLAGNAVWDGLIWIGSRLFRKL